MLICSLTYDPKPCYSDEMAGTKETKVSVSRRALIQRLTRTLRAEGEQLKATRGTRALLDLGEFYTVDVARNVVCRKNVDLVKLARQLGALRPYELLENS
jgi:hypothetical protein